MVGPPRPDCSYVGTGTGAAQTPAHPVRRSAPVQTIGDWWTSEGADAVCYVVRMNVRTNLLLPEEIVNGIDEVAGPRGRSRYVANAVARQLRRDRLMAAVDATAGAWKDHPLFPTDESVVEWVRAGRAEGRDPWNEDSR